MPLQPIPVTEVSAAESAARQSINAILNAAGQTIALRTSGVPARAGTPPRSLPNGQPVPGQPAVPAITPEQVDAALGEETIQILTLMKAAMDSTDGAKRTAALAALA